MRSRQKTIRGSCRGWRTSHPGIQGCAAGLLTGCSVGLQTRTDQNATTKSRGQSTRVGYHKPQKSGLVSGHEFTRAKRSPKNKRALAPAVRFFDPPTPQPPPIAQTPRTSQLANSRAAGANSPNSFPNPPSPNHPKSCHPERSEGPAVALAFAFSTPHPNSRHPHNSLPSHKPR